MPNNNTEIRLKPGREKSLKLRNFWVFSGAIAQPPQEADKPAAAVNVVSDRGEFLAVAGYSPKSQISAKVWSFLQEKINRAFFRRKIAAAYQLRQSAMIPQCASAYRLVAAEGDALPGIIIDLYNDFLVIQLLSAPADMMKDEIVGALLDLFPDIKGIYERSDADVRRKEGLPMRQGVIYGENPPPEIIISEYEWRLAADVVHGHKTGFYFDQRLNRKTAAMFAKDRTVLNLFSYTGGFAAAAATAQAAFVENVDSSAPALETARRNMNLNQIQEAKFRNTRADVFELMRQYEKERKFFDMIILDPPKLVDSKYHLIKGCRAYKELAMRAFKLLNPGGIIFTFSCSGLVSQELFTKITFDAALDSGRDAVILRRLAQDADHPVALNHPESSYLKGLMVAVNNS
ncbi:MAG: class I SAM-dependent rRNA methyltransferase [Victivallaceae bacterium]